MYAYYLNKGHALDSLLSLSYVEKIFYVESMMYNIEQENEKTKAMFGK
ncbi:hypothetical protein [Tissierella creatinophila]|uniref:Uncharacterized protein n=1 Tax=Tissierella creatinophila DSM 6911 TaxID=1123403 RepID=A0A1U7M4U6_TISCR|nr:hypothetical protein [Tissierella creatinophila]OLS02239.1 hypothetical protein TICRE_17910 [Tissierella creatinophila DSM 6911]